MAVAHLNDRFGAVETSMTVADPLVVSTGLPRFLSPGDSVEVSVTLSDVLVSVLAIQCSYTCMFSGFNLLFEM